MKAKISGSLDDVLQVKTLLRSKVEELQNNSEDKLLTKIHSSGPGSYKLVVTRGDFYPVAWLELSTNGLSHTAGYSNPGDYTTQASERSLDIKKVIKAFDVYAERI